MKSTRCFKIEKNQIQTRIYHLIWRMWRRKKMILE